MDGEVIDGGRFHDQRRFRSSEVTRAFTSTIQAVARGAQSEVSKPDEVTLEAVATSEMAIVRGID